MLLKKNTKVGKIKSKLFLLYLILSFLIFQTSILAANLEGTYTDIKVLDKISSKNILLKLKNGDEKAAKYYFSKAKANRYSKNILAQAIYNKDIREDRILPLIKWSNKLFPKVSTEHYRPWAGLRPMTPNMMPKIGKGKLPGIFYNTGHGHLGWTLSAFSSLLISDILLRTDNLN